MASLSVPCPKVSSAPLPLFSADHPLRRKFGSLSFGSQQLPKPALSGLRCISREQAAICKAHTKLDEVVAESSNSVPSVNTNSKITTPEKVEPEEATIPEPSEIAAFMKQVSDLVKLVDSRDIVELQLKQMDCELTIRKKEALQPAVMPQLIPQPVYHTAAPPPAPAPAPASQPSPAPVQKALAPPKAASSAHPRLKSPMAGTFYRCPAPGEPAFVKVGDKVQKGQVICIIEAMKLMNEIEADRSGTITEILLEDGKPVSVDTPLFVIAP